MMLDASRAFDRVDHIKSFKILSKKGVCPTLLKLLFNMSSQQTMSIRWDKVVSQPFTAGNGVKQGGFLPPILFTLYLDVLMDILKTSGFGCYVSNVFVGALAYADDIVILAPSRFALGRLLKQCSLFSKLYQFDFNASKSEFIIHRHNHEIYHEKIFYMNKKFQSQTNCRHLGNTVGSKQSEKRVISATADFNNKTNVLLSTFRNVNSKVKLDIFKAISMSLYGSPLWNFSSLYIDRFYVSWRKAIGRIFILPYRTHCKLLPRLYSITQVLPIDMQLHIRTVKFLKSI